MAITNGAPGRRKGRLIMIRHGQTAANIDKVWHGITDTPLTELGHHQARRLGDYFSNVMAPHAVYASPLQRARDTAEAIACRFGLEVQTDPRLQEFSLGDWEGVRFESIVRELDTENRLHLDPDFTVPNGDSQTLVKERMVEALEEIVQRHSDENVVVVSHGVAMAIAFCHYLHNDTTRWMQYAKHNTAYSEFCPLRRELVLFNCIDHLREDGD